MTSWQSRLVSRAMAVAVRPVAALAPLNRATLPLARWVIDRAVAGVGGLPVGTEWQPAPLRSCGAELINPGAPTTVVYFHGGGFLTGSARSWRPFLATLSRRCGVSVLAVDYRLVPEHTVADAIDDGVDACRWLLDRGVTDIVLAGDSAGGGLAVSVATRARDDGLPPLAGLVLFSPWARRGPAAPAADSFLTPRCIARVLRLCGAAPGSPDLHDLPPALILAGGRELLAADSHWLAQRFRDAGVSCELQVWPGQGHVFPLLRALPESAAALTEVARFLTTRAVEVARRR